MRCYEESQRITESSLKFMMQNMASTKLAVNSKPSKNQIHNAYSYDTQILTSKII